MAKGVILLCFTSANAAFLLPDGRPGVALQVRGSGQGISDGVVRDSSMLQRIMGRSEPEQTGVVPRPEQTVAITEADGRAVAIPKPTSNEGSKAPEPKPTSKEDGKAPEPKPASGDGGKAAEGRGFPSKADGKKPEGLSEQKAVEGDPVSFDSIINLRSQWSVPILVSTTYVWMLLVYLVGYCCRRKPEESNARTVRYTSDSPEVDKGPYARSFFFERMSEANEWRRRYFR